MAKETKLSLNKQGVGMVIGLVLQYILGISTNMFVKFPETGNEAQMWKFAKTQLLINLHMLVGTLLLLNSIILYIRAIKMRNKTWKIAGGLGFGSILIAAIAGSEFVGSQNDMFSLVMALAFIAALLSYVWAFTFLNNQATSL